MNLPTRTNVLLCWCLAVTTCLLCLLFPRMDGDAAVYAQLSRHMVQHGDWINLVFRGEEWLDKPHFPFWMMALSFKLFGVNEYAYQVPGLFFYGLGAWFTYKIALHFHDRAVASLACLMTLSLLGLLLGASDQKAEVYLLGLMTGASYAWLKYVDKASFRYGLLGAVCTACGVMTKGVFVLGILGVGVVALLVYRRAWSGLLHWKWLLAAAGCLLFVLPELMALYLQFDAHPDKLVFGRTQVSGLKFFLWDSQFGRFLNTGPIQNTKGSPFFFVHNLVWTFFPWAVVLVATVWAGLASMWQPDPKGGPAEVGQGERGASVFLWSTFFTAFALFSATKYQMDYYLIIVFPYAAIACAKCMAGAVETVRRLWLQRIHLWFAFTGLVLALVCTSLYFWHSDNAWVLLALVPVLAAVALMVGGGRRVGTAARMIAYPLCAVVSLFAFTVLFHRDLYLNYNVGHRIAQYTNTQEPHPVYVVNMVFNTFDFFSQWPSLPVSSADDLVGKLWQGGKPSGDFEPFYLIVRSRDAPAFVQGLEKAGQRMQARTLNRFDEIELPKQFVWQLLKNDAALPRQEISVMQLGPER